ncbi:MAG: hypothetical protein QG646_4082 [Euryarchaeota archaeon]|nr:hypothetical protein [Euryarchaeota archaeon]
MDKMDSNKSIIDRIKSLWNSLPGFVRFIGTLLSIFIAVKALAPAAALDINHFGASPEVIGPGDSSILSWEVSGASNISIEPGIGSVSSNGSISVSPSQTTTYKLIISGEGKEKTASCTITVNKDSPLITSFEASPNAIKAGESAVLNWHVTGASNVNIEPDIGAVESSATLSVSPVKTITYTLTASNDDKKDVAYCTVTVEGNLTSSQDNPVSEKDNLSSQNASQKSQASQTSQTNQGNLPTINFFNANPDMVSKGESSNLTWNVLSATKISIEPGIGTVGLTGSQRIFPSQNTTYTLTATNEVGSVHAIKVIYVQESSASTSSTSTSSTSSTSTPSSSSSSTQVSSKALPTPKQLSPANGTVFDNSTSGTTLEWTDVSGAANYTVEIDAFNSNSNSWLSESAGSNVVSGINATSYSYDFSTIGPVRWRVWSVGSDGKEGKKSEWWIFNLS